MDTDAALLARLREINGTASFNRWLGLRVDSAESGRVSLSMAWRADVGQYADFLHAGIIGALIDTACGFAAVSVAGARVLASHYSVNCLRPAIGDSFVVRARVVKPGKTQVFTAAELFGVSQGAEKLVATGETILVVGTGSV